MSEQRTELTRPLGVDTAAWPGDTPFGLEWTWQLSRGDSVSVSRLTFSPHVGTHADAAAHYAADGDPAGAFDLAAFVGPVRVVDVRGCGAVTADVLAERGALGRPRVLVRCLDVVRPDEFVSDFAPLDPDAAAALVRSGLRLYGTDAPSVDPVDSAEMRAHRALGGGGVPILENLDLSAAEPGDYDLLALQVRLTEAEAAPVRAVLLPAGTLRAAR